MGLVPERFKVKVTQEDADSMNGVFWSPRMIEILLAFWRWVVLGLCLVLALTASSVGGVVYFTVVSLLAFALIRRVSAWTWLQQRRKE